MHLPAIQNWSDLAWKFSLSEETGATGTLGQVLNNQVFRETRWVSLEMIPGYTAEV